MDCSLPGSSVHGILQARILEWVAISFSRRSLPAKLPGKPTWRLRLGNSDAFCLSLLPALPEAGPVEPPESFLKT